LAALGPEADTSYSLDVFGTKIVTSGMEQLVSELTETSGETSLNIGYVIGSVHNIKKFEFKGIEFPLIFIMSRLVLVGLGLLFVFLISPIFNRFDNRERSHEKKVTITSNPIEAAKEVALTMLPKAQINYGIVPLIKTEALLLFRKGKKWLWIVNLIGMVLLATLPMQIAHQMVLPILWFLQVGRLSDLGIKEHLHHTHHFAFASYRPVSRLLTSQLIASTALMIALALPLVIRLGLTNNTEGGLSIILGAIFIVMFAALLGILSKGRKLFEVLFFMISYVIINGMSFVDYFGAFKHHNFYLAQLIGLVIVTTSIVIFKRKYELVQ
jgi:hypothetical protein